MSKVTIIGTVHNLSATENNGCRFDLEYQIDDKTYFVSVKCNDKLFANEVQSNIKNGDHIAVNGTAVTDNPIIYTQDRIKIKEINAIIVVTDNDEVYPKRFPKDTAIKERDNERNRENIRKIAFAAAEPNDPF